MFGAFLSFSLYRTYAYDTSVVEETPSTTDLEYTFKIGNSSIKQITVDSGETKYYDIVLGNPNPAKISYSIYYEMVSPSTKPDGFKIEYTSKSTGESTGKVDKEGNITLNIEVTNTSSSAVTVKIGSVAGYVNGGELILGSGQVVIPKRVTASEYIMSLDDGTTGDDGSGVYKVSHNAISADSSATGSEIKASDDYRYYGASPNNYICLDMEDGSTCTDKHLYRIIGSMREDSDGTYKVKVVKANLLINGSYSTFMWNSSISNIWATITNGSFSNSIINGSSLMIFLNNDFLGTSASSPLSDTAQRFISYGLFYLSGWNTTDVYVSAIYGYERGMNVIDTTHPLSWFGKIGLMYASDYGYASGSECVTKTTLYNYNENCILKNWLHMSVTEWLITPYSDNYDTVFQILSTGSVASEAYRFQVTTAASVRPTFYLDKDVSITSGTGTESDPYQLSVQ